MHSSAHQFVCQMIACYGQPEAVVEIGSYNVNGSVRPLFKRAIDEDAYVGVDIRAGPGVDVVECGSKYRPPKDRFPDGVDCVVSCECLEHAPPAKAIVQNAVGMLRPGGIFILTCACHPRARHTSDGAIGGSEYYRNVSPDDVTDWLNEAKVTSFAVASSEALGDLYAWAIK